MRLRLQLLLAKTAYKFSADQRHLGRATSQANQINLRVRNLSLLKTLIKRRKNILARLLRPRFKFSPKKARRYLQARVIETERCRFRTGKIVLRALDPLKER